MASQAFVHGRVFVASAASLAPAPGEEAGYFAEAFEVLPGGTFGKIGTTSEVRQAVAARSAASGSQPSEVDLAGKLVLPGMVDGHAHIGMLGSSLDKVDLRPCQSLQDIQSKIKHAVHAAPPGTSRVRAKHWLQSMTNGEAFASALDEVSPDVPVYIESLDLHSAWLNSAALRELEIAKDTPDPKGGRIARDETGTPTGLLEEGAVIFFVWDRLARFSTPEEQEADMERAFHAYLSSGYTGTVDMAFVPPAYETLRRVQRKNSGTLPLRVTAYWLIEPTEDPEERLQQVRQVAKQQKAERKEYPHDPWFKTVGIKIVSDGVIDGCTAATREPYANGTKAEGLWTLDELKPVVKLADELGLQVATHAIGDLAVHNAIEAYAQLAPGQDALRDAVKRSPPTAKEDKRHRIEHLELTARSDVERLGQLGIIASVQPVHSDPQILPNWWAMLGDPPNEGRCARGFAYREFVQCGAHLVVGTDTPTAPYQSLPNFHNAVHRRSALKRDNPLRTTPQFALPLATTVAAASAGAAWSVRREDVCGAIRTGLSADFAVIGSDVFEQTARGETFALLDARVLETYLLGQRVFRF